MAMHKRRLGWSALAFSLGLALPVNSHAQDRIHAPVSGLPVYVNIGQIAPPQEVAGAALEASSNAAVALREATSRVAGWQSLPKVSAYTDILNPDRPHQGSLSMGTVGSGFMVSSTNLEFVGKDHEIIERHRRYGTAYATDEMVQLIKVASAHVNEHSPGAPLRVGNMSRSKGGDIRWSRSHNSGRDADLGFYVKRKADGKSVRVPGIIHFDENGVPEGYPDLIFDVERNWLLVRGMLQTDINVQYLFISLPLKHMLLDHARATNEPAELVDRASKVLHQPTDALPHDDHFHLRIGCSKDDRLRGCVDTGPRWDWCDWHDAELLAQAIELSRGLEHEKDVDTKLAILDYMDTTRNPFASEIALTKGVYDPAPEIRERSWQLARYTYPWTATTLVAAAKLIDKPSTSLDEKIMAYSILRRSADPVAHEYVLGKLRSSQTEPNERRFAARALRHTTNADYVKILFDELEQQPAPVRLEIADVLRRLTNHATTTDWASAGPAERTKALAEWRTWYAENAHLDRDNWIFAGMLQAGADVRSMDANAVDAMLPLLKTGEAHVVYNANRLMRKVTGRWAPLEQSDGRKLHDYWSKWWKKNRDRFLAEPE